MKMRFKEVEKNLDLEKELKNNKKNLEPLRQIVESKEPVMSEEEFKNFFFGMVNGN